jgi:hypothetical protein
MELGRTLSRKVSTGAFLFKLKQLRTKKTSKTKNKVMREKRSVLIDCLLAVPWSIHLGFIYTT